MPAALRPVGFQQCGIGGARAIRSPSSSRDKTKRIVSVDYSLQGKGRPAAGSSATANATAAAMAASAAATSAPDLGLFAAVTIGAAIAPWLMESVRPWLRPIRCGECMGATTTLCTRCGARGKVRFVLGSATVALLRFNPHWLDLHYMPCSQAKHRRAPDDRTFSSSTNLIGPSSCSTEHMPTRVPSGQAGTKAVDHCIAQAITPAP